MRLQQLIVVNTAYSHTWRQPCLGDGGGNYLDSELARTFFEWKWIVICPITQRTIQELADCATLEQ